VKDIIKWNEFYYNFDENKKSQFSMLEMSIFCDSLFLIANERTVDSKVRTYDAAFVLNQNQIYECQFSWKCANDTIESDFDVFREVLRLSGGSSCEGISTFYRQRSNHCIEIDDSVRIIDVNTFRGGDSLTEIIFSSRNNLKEIHGFENCVSLCRIEIPSSVKLIGQGGFSGCTSFHEVIFSSVGHLREMFVTYERWFQIVRWNLLYQK
jgi:hypothetical protein